MPSAVLSSGDSEARVKELLETPGDWVEIPNRRRGGESGVCRVHLASGEVVYRKQQIGHIYRSFRYPFGYPTVGREVKALRAASLLGVLTPLLLYSNIRRLSGEWRAVMITTALDGFVSLEDFYAHGLDKMLGQVLHLEILEQFGRSLALLNTGRWQHGCLYLKHIFVDFREPDVKVALLDFEKSRRRLTARQAGRHDLRQVKRRSGWRTEEWRAFCLGYSEVFGVSADQLL
ncbi:InaA protein [Pseudomonas putida]|nr:InaA protein [Pseudomonas putida]